MACILVIYNTISKWKKLKSSNKEKRMKSPTVALYFFVPDEIDTMHIHTHFAVIEMRTYYCLLYKSQVHYYKTSYYYILIHPTLCSWNIWLLSFVFILLYFYIHFCPSDIPKQLTKYISYHFKEFNIFSARMHKPCINHCHSVHEKNIRQLNYFQYWQQNKCFRILEGFLKDPVTLKTEGIML